VSQNITLPVDVHLVMWRVDGSLLLARSAEPDAPWRLPGGGLRSGETAREAVLRIADDTVSVTTMMAHVWLAHVAHHHFPDEGERLGLFFRLTHWRGIPAPGRDGQARRLAWHHVDALPDSVARLDLEAIERWKIDGAYSEPGWQDQRIEAAS
jgi:8-oxo-dGTP diphosphatase